MGDKPRVTAVIPCYNHGKFVEAAVRSMLNQQDALVRIVIVDDGSDDGVSPALCDQAAQMGPNIRVVHQPNRGLSAARNEGAKMAAQEDWGEYLVFLDADDWVEPTFVAKLHQRIVNEGSAGADVSHAYCQERLVEKGTGIWKVPEWDPMLLRVTNLHPVTALVKRSCFQAVGGFDESFRCGYEDWNLWLGMAERGWRGVRVCEPLFVWRRHSETTMVMEAAKKHGELFAMIIDRHPSMYEGRAREIIELSNVLLRRADANWIDENGEAIYVRDLRSRNCELFDLHEAAQARIRELEASVKSYERKPAVIMSRWLFNTLDALPRPLGAPVRWLAEWARKRVL